MIANPVTHYVFVVLLLVLLFLVWVCLKMQFGSQRSLLATLRYFVTRLNSKSKIEP